MYEKQQAFKQDLLTAIRFVIQSLHLSRLSGDHEGESWRYRRAKLAVSSGARGIGVTLVNEHL